MKTLLKIALIILGLIIILWAVFTFGFYKT